MTNQHKFKAGDIVQIKGDGLIGEILRCLKRKYPVLGYRYKVLVEGRGIYDRFEVELVRP